MILEQKNRAIKTRTKYKIVGSDYSAQEPRLTAFLAQDPGMLQAYAEGKDLYSVIAQKMFDNRYEDNLEWYTPGKIIDIDGKQIVSGTGNEFEVKTDNADSITINYYDILTTVAGEKSAKEVNVNDRIISDVGDLIVVSKTRNNDLITLKVSL